MTLHKKWCPLLFDAMLSLFFSRHMFQMIGKKQFLAGTRPISKWKRESKQKLPFFLFEWRLQQIRKKEIRSCFIHISNNIACSNMAVSLQNTFAKTNGCLWGQRKRNWINSRRKIKQTEIKLFILLFLMRKSVVVFIDIVSFFYSFIILRLFFLHSTFIQLISIYLSIYLCTRVYLPVFLKQSGWNR